MKPLIFQTPKTEPKRETESSERDHLRSTVQHPLGHLCGTPHHLGLRDSRCRTFLDSGRSLIHSLAPPFWKPSSTRNIPLTTGPVDIGNSHEVPLDLGLRELMQWGPGDRVPFTLYYVQITKVIGSNPIKQYVVIWCEITSLSDVSSPWRFHGSRHDSCK